MMKKLILAFCMLQGILLSLGAQDMHQNIAYADNNVRFTVISDGTLRLEYAPDGKFVDNKSFCCGEPPLSGCRLQAEVKRGVD